MLQVLLKKFSRIDQDFTARNVEGLDSHDRRLRGGRRNATIAFDEREAQLPPKRT
jgi:hypothetical protein